MWEWGPIRAKFIILDQPPPKDQISNINLVPKVGNQYVLLQHAGGNWGIAGGTLEPGEDYPRTLERELMEEAGAELLSFRLIGAWHCFSFAEKPYRPHLPFPEHYRLVGVGQVKIVGEPTNPIGAEQITKVACEDLNSSVGKFISSGRHDLAELYQFADEMENQ